VEPIDLYLYYRLGSAMRTILGWDSDGKATFGSLVLQAFEAHGAIEELNKSGLEHSISAAKDLSEKLFNLPQRDSEGRALFDKEVEQYKISQAEQAVRDLQAILIAYALMAGHPKQQ
jgi:hypothetical protein